MTFYELVCFTRVFNVANGLAHPSTITCTDIDVAFEVLKKMADNRNDVSPEYKELYKVIVDYVKEQIKNSGKANI